MCLKFWQGITSICGGLIRRVISVTVLCVNCGQAQPNIEWTTMYRHSNANHCYYRPWSWWKGREPRENARCRDYHRNWAAGILHCSLETLLVTPVNNTNIQLKMSDGSPMAINVVFVLVVLGVLLSDFQCTKTFSFHNQS